MSNPTYVPQNPSATPADSPFDEPARTVQHTLNRFGEPQEPDTAVGDHRVGPNSPEDVVAIPYLDETDSLGINDNLAELSEWWIHIQWEDFGGWNHSHHKFVYPGHTAVPLYAEPVEQYVLYLKTKAYYDDVGYWRNGQNPMFDTLINTREMSKPEFYRRIVELTNDAYRYARRYQERKERSDDEPKSTHLQWGKRTPEDARQGTFRPQPPINPLDPSASV